jgi:hypothetical protein
VFLDLKTENLNFRRQIPLATFRVQMDNSICYNGSKVVSKFDKHHIAALTLFTRLEPVRLLALRSVERYPDREFHSHDETEEAITMAWNDLTFADVQSLFHNWRNRLRWVIENGESTLLNENESVYLCLLNDEIRGGRGPFLPPVESHCF